MTHLSSLLLLEPDVKWQQRLTLILRSGGGFQVCCRHPKRLQLTAMNPRVDMLLCRYKSAADLPKKLTLSSLPICYYLLANDAAPDIRPNSAIIQVHPLPAFAEQVRHAFHLLNGASL